MLFMEKKSYVRRKPHLSKMWLNPWHQKKYPAGLRRSKQWRQQAHPPPGSLRQPHPPLVVLRSISPTNKMRISLFQVHPLGGRKKDFDEKLALQLIGTNRAKHAAPQVITPECPIKLYEKRKVCLECQVKARLEKREALHTLAASNVMRLFTVTVYRTTSRGTLVCYCSTHAV